MSMFVSSKWQRLVLTTRWRASVRVLFYCYLTFLDHRTNISKKVHAPRRVSVTGAQNKFQNCHLDKTNVEKISQNPKVNYFQWHGFTPLAPIQIWNRWHLHGGTFHIGKPFHTCVVLNKLALAFTYVHTLHCLKTIVSNKKIYNWYCRGLVYIYIG